MAARRAFASVQMGGRRMLVVDDGWCSCELCVGIVCSVLLVTGQMIRRSHLSLRNGFKSNEDVNDTSTLFQAFIFQIHDLRVLGGSDRDVEDFCTQCTHLNESNAAKRTRRSSGSANGSKSPAQLPSLDPSWLCCGPGPGPGPGGDADADADAILVVGSRIALVTKHSRSRANLSSIHDWMFNLGFEQWS